MFGTINNAAPHFWVYTSTLHICGPHSNTNTHLGACSVTLYLTQQIMPYNTVGSNTNTYQGACGVKFVRHHTTDNATPHFWDKHTSWALFDTSRLVLFYTTLRLLL